MTSQECAPWADPENYLRPTTKHEFRDSVAPCLALVGGVGMNADARREWLIAAYSALSHLPVDLLERGCKVAMQTVDHPSKIVPAIIEETRWAYDTRKRHGPATYNIDAPLIEQQEPQPVCSPEDAAKILAEYGLKSETQEKLCRYLGEPRVPTEADYAELRKSMGI